MAGGGSDAFLIAFPWLSIREMAQRGVLKGGVV